MSTFIKRDDSRVKSIKGSGNYYLYHLSKFEQNIEIEKFSELKKFKKTYQERDLHKLLSSYLKNKNIYAKTILHEESKNSKDDHQKWKR